jgi:very-short-patch-repair endonuclease
VKKVSMPLKNIITGQRVHTEIRRRAKEMRLNMTVAEGKLWQRLRAGRLEGFHFRRQQIIDGYIVDFYCHAAGIVVEVDGDVHLEQQQYDQERDKHLSDIGLSVLRFYNTDINENIEAVLREIVEACRKGEAAE